MQLLDHLGPELWPNSINKNKTELKKKYCDTNQKKSKCGELRNFKCDTNKIKQLQEQKCDKTKKCSSNKNIFF